MLFIMSRSHHIGIERLQQSRQTNPSDESSLGLLHDLFQSCVELQSSRARHLSSSLENACHQWRRHASEYFNYPYNIDKNQLVSKIV